MSAVTPARIGAGQKPKEGLLHERGRLHRVILPFPPEVPARQPMQLGSNQGQKTVQGIAVTLPPDGEQSRDLARLGLHPSTPSRAA